MLFDEMEDEDSAALFDTDDLDDLVEATSDDPHEVPVPRATARLIGHDAIEQQLLSMMENNRFPHGLIFSGLEGVGKSVMAYRLARYLFAKGGKQEETLGLFGDAPPKDTSLYIPESDPVFSLVSSGGHPDLRVIGRPYDEEKGRFKASVLVEDIRKIAPFMRQTASVTDGWRIVVIDDADTMTRSSQNSLLKILEEPPEKALLILIAHRAGALLPTIYSRCVHIPFAPLSEDQIRSAIAGRCPPDKASLIVSMAEGSLGAAYEYSEDQYADVIAQSIGLLNDGQKFRWGEIQTFADFFGNKGNDDAQRIFKETMLWFAGSLVRNRLASGFDTFRSWPLSRRLKLYDDLRVHFDRCLIGNLDKRFLILGAYMAFE